MSNYYGFNFKIPNEQFLNDSAKGEISDQVEWLTRERDEQEFQNMKDDILEAVYQADLQELLWLFEAYLKIDMRKNWGYYSK